MQGVIIKAERDSVMPVINSVESQHISFLSFHLDALLVQVKKAEKRCSACGVWCHEDCQSRTAHLSISCGSRYL